MKHVGTNSCTEYQRNDMKSYGGLYYAYKGSYHQVYKNRFFDEQDRRKKQRKVHSVTKNEHNLKHMKAQNQKRSFSFNHKKT
jgi:hypothetical protein